MKKLQLDLDPNEDFASEEIPQSPAEVEDEWNRMMNEAAGVSHQDDESEQYDA